MGRPRTIKPEFFTSEDVVRLTPLARILYVGLWCEADREGRMLWKPLSFKFRYLPADACEIETLCEELLSAGLIALYGNGCAFIPTFKIHQHINPREAASILPDPDACPTRHSRVTHASLTRPDASSTREHASTESVPPFAPLSPQHSPLPPIIPPETISPPARRFHKPTLVQVREYMAEVGLPASEASKFMDYHDSKGWVVGRAPMKDWKAAVRTWKGNYKPTNGNVPVSAASRLTQEEIANINR